MRRFFDLTFRDPVALTGDKPASKAPQILGDTMR